MLFLLGTLGGLAPGAVRHLHDLSRRGLDRTEYITDDYRSKDKFVLHWARRISAALVTADARRCLSRLPALATRARGAHADRAARRAMRA